MRNGTYIAAFHVICVKESIRVEANALSLGFWPQLCSKSFSELIGLKVELNDIPAKIMISFSYWSLWKLVTNSDAELALVVLHPAVSGGPGSCCSSLIGLSPTETQSPCPSVGSAARGQKD